MISKSLSLFRVDILVICLMASCAVIGTNILIPVFPKLNLLFPDFPNVEMWSKAILVAPSLSMGIIAPIAGLILDNFNNNKIVKASASIYIISGLAGFFVSTPPVLLTLRILVGLCAAFLIAAAFRGAATRYQGHERNIVFGFKNSAMAIAGIASSLLGGVLGQNNPRYVFLIFIVAAPLLFSKVMPIERNQEEIQKPTLTSERLFSISGILFFTFISMAIVNVATIELPILLTETFQYSTLEVSFLFVYVIAGSFFSSIFFGKTIAKLDIPSGLIICLLTLAAGFFLVHLRIVPFSISFLTIGLGVGCLTPNLARWISQHAPRQKLGQIMGLFTSALYLGQFVSPFLFQETFMISPEVLLSAAQMALILSGIILTLWLFQYLANIREKFNNRIDT